MERRPGCAYSHDLRERVVAAVGAGTPIGQVARQFRVHVSTVYRYLAQQRTTGDLTPGRGAGRPTRIPPDWVPQLVAQLQAAPTATLAEHCAAWEQATGLRLSRATLSRAIQRLGWTRKKGRWQPVSGTTRGGLPGGPRR